MHGGLDGVSWAPQAPKTRAGRAGRVLRPARPAQDGAQIGALLRTASFRRGFRDLGRDRSRYLDPKCTAASPEARGIVPPIVTAGLAGMPPLTAEQKANFMPSLVI